MAVAMLSGLLQKRTFLKENIVVSDISETRLDYMSSKFGVKTTDNNK